MNRKDTFRHIADQAGNGEINLPASVNAALRLQTALDDPDCPLENAIKLVGGEPQLAARVVALANSAAFKRGDDTEVTNVRAAIVRVGYKSLKTMAATLVVKQLGERISDAKLRARAERLWLHSANVAALAHVLARRVTGVDADTAMFAGIVHEVGGLYLLSRAEEFPGLLDDEPALWNEVAEAIVTREVLKKLLIPEAVSAAIMAAHNGSASPTPATLSETLVLANEYALVPSPLGESADVYEPENAHTDFVIDSSRLTKLVDESTDELRSIIAALM